MKGLEFPIVGTKVKGLKKLFDISSRGGRAEYFEAKVGVEIKAIKKYLETNTFMVYMVGKKNSGKGTYSKMMEEVFGSDKIVQVSVGDLVRELDKNWEEFQKSEEYSKLVKSYRGYVSFEECINRLRSRSTQGPLLPTEFILALLKVRLQRYQGKAIFVDGLPRDMDQVSYSLFFRDLANLRDDPDMFILIDIPMTVIDERIKYRVICPKCNTSRNPKLLVTKDIEYDEKMQKYYLLCDNPECKGVRMVPKEGDNLGIEPIKSRLEKDEEILKKIFELHGMPKILLRNHVPVTEAVKYFDPYELTPEFVLSHKEDQVVVDQKPWTIKDDSGIESYSLMAPAVVVTLIDQLADVLEV